MFDALKPEVKKAVLRVKELEGIMNDSEMSKSRSAEARKSLNQIYDGDAWHSARYVAGIALGNVDMVVNLRATEGIQELGDRIEKYSIEIKDAAEIEYDAAMFDMAEVDLKWMYKNMPEKEHRVNAGANLGYSPLRIWFKEWITHPLG